MLKLQEVWKSYGQGDGRVDAIRSVSLALERGEFVSIMGPSGSGKSTLLHILGAMDRPTRGSVLWNGQATEQWAERELEQLRLKRIGFVFQMFNLMQTLTAVENAALPLLLAGVSRRERLARGMSMLERVGLGNRANHLPAQLSGGQRQRVAIARALIHGPDMILADEPTGALDTVAGQGVLDLLEDAHREGCTVVIVTHDAAVAARADRMIRLRDGTLVDE